MKNKIIALSLGILFLAACSDPGSSGGSKTLSVSRIMSFDTGNYDQSAAEIVEYYPEGKKILYTNGMDGSLGILGYDGITLSSPAYDTFALGDANSVSINGDLAAVAVAAANKTDNGSVYFVDLTDGSVLGSVAVGALPDMVTFTPDGTYVIVANEGEPSEEYTVDPEGTVSIITVNRTTPSSSTVATVSFVDSDLEDSTSGISVRTHSYLSDYDGALGYAHTTALDLEPEYIAVDADSEYAYVTMQENNAIAKIDIAAGTVETVKSLGLKDFSSCGVDLVEDGRADVTAQPFYGFYMPDSITAFEIGGKTYLATANEGDDRADWEDNTDFEDNDVTKAKKLVGDFGLTLGSDLVDGNGDLLADLEDVKVSPHDCDLDGDDTVDFLVGFGGRSFSIWDENLDQVYDSGSLFETYTAQLQPDFFNCSNDNLTIDDRSPKKGPEPEAICSGEVNGTPMVFVGLERFGGFFVFDVSDPSSPKMLGYHTDRRFDASVDSDGEYTSTTFANTGDLGPEGFHFVTAEDSLSGNAQLITGSEVSGTVSVYGIDY